MEDQKIVQLYWDRDERAIEESEKKYGGLCRGVALRVLENTEDSEECVSDTWLRSWNVIPPQRPSLLGAFLARITRNLALDRWRASHAAKRFGGEMALALEELGDCVSGESLEDEAARRELARVLNAFLRSETGLILSAGGQYGKGGEAFLRLNTACPRSLLEDGLKRLVRGVKAYIGRE